MVQRDTKRVVSLRPAGALAPRDRIWAAIRHVVRFDVDTLYIACRGRPPVATESIREYLRLLHGAGFVRQTTPPMGQHAARYELTRDVGVEAPRFHKSGALVVTTQRELLWGALKVLGEYTARELAAHAPAGRPRATVGAARYFLAVLQPAGYVVQIRAKGARRSARYRAIEQRCRGARPPEIRARRNAVFDPNRNRVVWTREGGQQW